MTALTIASGSRDTDLRPVPWRRMAWVIWRQHRATLAGVIALLGALALYLWLAGTSLHHAYEAVTDCRPTSSVACSTALSNFTANYDHTANIVPALLQAVPALIGAFVGAPILARELENGTFRYTWTQGFGRWRWTLATLVSLAILAIVAAGIFSILFSWYYRPFLADHQATPLTATVFNLRGIGFAAWTLTAFAIGALAGILTRRVVPAIVTTLTAYAGLAAFTAVFLRRHYLSPLTTNKLPLSPSALITSTWGTKNGTVAFTGRAPGYLLQHFCPPTTISRGKPSSGALSSCLAHHGYTIWTSYQPASRFWTFQWLESSWLVVLSALLIALSIWLVERRAT